MDDHDGAVGRGAVRIEFRKWPDIPHWRYAMWPLGEDEHGTWLWAPAGTEARRGIDEPIRFETLAVKLIPRDRWWTVMWNQGDVDGIEMYVDITTPPQWDDDRVTMVDLDLDIARRRDGSIEILDEDEFEEHRVTLQYPEHIADRARSTAAAVYLAVGANEEPFAAAGARRLDEAGSLATT